MSIEYSLPFPECENCNRFLMNVKRQTYLFPLRTMPVTKVSCKHEAECIKQVERLKKMEVANDHTQD